MTTESQEPPRSWLRRIFVSRDVFRLWSGQVISETGTSVFRMAFVWVVVRVASGSAAGVIVALGSLPSLLLGPYSGALVDRMDRRRTVLVADMTRACIGMVIWLLFLLGRLDAWTLGGLTFLMATFGTLYTPARDTLVGQIVQPRDRLAANTMIQASWQYAILLGPPVAGLVIILTSKVHLFLVDAFSYVVSFLLILGIGSSSGGFRRPRPGEFLRALGRGWADTLVGLRYVATQPQLRGLLIVTAVDNFFLMGPAVFGRTVLAQKDLKMDMQSFAFLGISTAIGMIASTMLLTRYARKLRSSRLLLWGIILDGITFVPMLWVNSFWTMFLVLAVHAMAIPLIVVVRPTIIHNTVPSEMQGRVFSLIATAVSGFMALSISITGLLDAAQVPIRWIYAGGGVLAALSGVGGYLIGGFKEMD